MKRGRRDKRAGFWLLLTAWLLALTAAATGGETADGAALYPFYGCAACHGWRGEGGRASLGQPPGAAGPPLAGTVARWQSRYGIEWRARLREWLRFPTAEKVQRDPTLASQFQTYGYLMPQLDLSEEEAERLITYLEAFPTPPGGPLPARAQLPVDFRWRHNGKEWPVGWVGRTLEENGVTLADEQLGDFVLWGWHHGLQLHRILPVKPEDPGVPFLFAPGTPYEAVVLYPWGSAIFHIVTQHQLRDDMFPQLFPSPRGVNLGAILATRKAWANFFTRASRFGLFIFHKIVSIDLDRGVVRMEPPIGLSWEVTLREAALEMTHNPLVRDLALKEFYEFWKLYGKGFATGPRRWKRP